jgi:hypothetical protein
MGRSAANSEWTDAEERELSAMWNVQNKTLREIAAAMPGRSHNAVAGKLHRLKTPKRDISARPAIKQVHKGGAPAMSRKPTAPTLERAVVFVPAADLPPPIDAPIEPPVVAAPVTDAGVEYMQLRDGMCRAPLNGRGSDGLILSCGKRTGYDIHGEKSPYCPGHHRRFHGGHQET